MISQINFVPGDLVRVHQKIKEGDKTRIQVFQGTVLAIKGRGENKSFTVRKLVGPIAVERIWPVASPNIERVEVKAHSKKKVRRAKLYYLRNKKN
ncbi:MAG: 50S ribosomal protein L19 [Candidatus Levybacteria bacterium]|nr:50S ribosomal protein L19 [Candidatus Levybacteria bacterium]